MPPDVRRLLAEAAASPNRPVDTPALQAIIRRRRHRARAVGGLAAVGVLAAAVALGTGAATRVELLPAAPAATGPPPAPPALPETDPAGETIGDAAVQVPPDWQDVIVGEAVLSVPPLWEVTRGQATPCQPFLRPRVTVVEGSLVPSCPSPSPGLARETGVVARSLEYVEPPQLDLLRAGEAVVVGGRHARVVELQRSTASPASAEREYLVEDLGIVLHVSDGPDPALAAQVLATLRPARIAAALRTVPCDGGGPERTPPAALPDGWEAWPPLPFDADPSDVSVVAAGGVVIVLADTGGDAALAGAVYDPTAGRWACLPPAPVGARAAAATVWTGTELIVWGGEHAGRAIADGAAYDQRTGSWRMLPAAPLSARRPFASVWTGSEMLVWGGTRAGRAVPDGAAYDPAAGTWRPIADAPAAFNQGAGVWTGAELVVQGSRLGSGNHALAVATDTLAYNPDTDSWRQLARSPLSPQASTVAWTGSAVVGFDYLLGAAEYDPAAERWTALPSLPLRAQECYPSSAATAGGDVVAWYCGQAAVFRPAEHAWRAVAVPDRALAAVPATLGDRFLLVTGDGNVLTHSTTATPPTRGTPTPAPEPGPATWQLDPAHPAPTPASTEVHLLVTELACSGGTSPADRLRDPEIASTEDTVTVSFTVESVGEAECPGIPAHPVTVALPEPLGSRRLVDGHARQSQG